MPITITYDFAGDIGNHRSWLRSMLERFGFRRLGGSVFRYQGTRDASGHDTDDWLNHVAPALMLFRSYVVHNGLTLSRFTIDAHSVAFVDLSDAAAPIGTSPCTGAAVALESPTNAQAGEKDLRKFVDDCTATSP